MCGLKCSIRVLVIALIIQSGHLISTGPRNGPDEILWSLSQLAIQGRQLSHNPQRPTEFQLHPERFSKYTGPIKASPVSRGQYGLLQNYPRPHPNFQTPNPGFSRPYPGYPPGFSRPPPALPPGYYQPQQNLGFPQQSFTGALQSVAQNDNLRCVPRLLCELTSGPSAGQKQESGLPFNINLESLMGVLSAVGGQTSPILEFGKAALLGYTSKGNSGSCLYAYPRCPQDPDRLIEYLNNHNGGFFRFFNGVPPSGFPQNPQQLPYPLHLQQPHYPQQNPPFNPYQYPRHYPQQLDFYGQKQIVAQKRILTKPALYFDSNSQPGIKFPSRFNDDVSNEVIPQQESVVFPEPVNLNGYEQQVKDHRGRRQKALTFPSSDFNFEKTLPNIKQVTMIFPDRTGTGELRLDVEEDVNVNYYNRYFPYNQEKYYRKTNENNFGAHGYFDNKRKLVTFPVIDQDT